MTKGRRPEPRIVDLATYPLEAVNLCVAANYLDVDARTVKARIEEGKLPAEHDGKIYRIPVTALAAYKAHRDDLGC